MDVEIVAGRVTSVPPTAFPSIKDPTTQRRRKKKSKKNRKRPHLNFSFRDEILSSFLLIGFFFQPYRDKDRLISRRRRRRRRRRFGTATHVRGLRRVTK